jgi:transposase InsO family protein
MSSLGTEGIGHSSLASTDSSRFFAPGSLVRNVAVGAGRLPCLNYAWGLRRALFQDIEDWYNARRLRSSLNYLSFAEYEATSQLNSDHRAT